ncbi:MAG: haloacid dehalogenase-like hydrolase [Desulfocapsa sp.]|nr:haloacid dehalogenase-like hydrolase [Desulfocapsa sp.]
MGMYTDTLKLYCPESTDFLGSKLSHPDQFPLHSQRRFDERPGLKLRNWSPFNYHILRSWLTCVQEVPFAGNMAAIFDFDNTCIYRDVGKAVFRFQLSGLHFRLFPKHFESLFPDIEEHIGGKSFSLVKNRLVTLYKNLWPFIQQKELAQGLLQREYVEFVDLLFWYCSEARRLKSLGPQYTLTFLARLLAGFSTDEVEDLTCQALVSALREPITTQRRTVCWRDTIGTINFRYETGLRLHPEMFDLMNCLQHAGICSYIVSASTEWIVKAAVLFFDIPVRQKNIFGIRVQLDREKILTTEVPTDYPVTYRAGKIKIIHDHIKATPILVAGDAETDYEMLTMPKIPIRLIINHNKSDLISTLYNDTRYLLQGLNKTTGFFRPHRQTLDKTEKLFS